MSNPLLDAWDAANSSGNPLLDAWDAQQAASDPKQRPGETNEQYWQRRLAGQGSISATEAPKPSVASVVRGAANTARATTEGIHQIIEDAVPMPFLTPSQKSASEASQLRETQQANARQQAERPQFESKIASGLYGAVESTIQQAPGLIASVATGNPAPGLAWAGVTSGTQAYGKYRGRGGTAGEAALGATGEGSVEVLTELLPMGELIKGFGKEGGKHFLKQALKSVAADVPGEQIATLAQDAIDTAIANPNKTWGDYIKERPSAALETLVASVGQGAIMTAGGYAVHRISNRSTGPGEVETAQADAELTEEDRASPLPNDILAAGKSTQAEIDGSSRADAILAQHGMPRVRTPVEVTDWNGQVRRGVVEDAFSTDDSAGLKVRFDDGSLFEDHFADIADAGVKITPIRQSAAEITAQMEADAAAAKERSDTAVSQMEVAPPVSEAIEPVSAAQPVAQVATQAVGKPVDQAISGYMQRTRKAESGGNDNAKNPGTSASGRYQFTDGTWLATYRAVYGDTGESRETILARKSDGKVQDVLMERLTRDNANGLKAAGIPVDDNSLYIAHFAGIGGARALYRADPNTPVESVLGAEAVQKNSFLRGMTTAQAIAELSRRHSGTKSAPVDVASEEPVQVAQAAPEAPYADPYAKPMEDYQRWQAEQDANSPASGPDAPLVAPEASAAPSPSAQVDVSGRAPQDVGGTPAEPVAGFVGPEIPAAPEMAKKAPDIRTNKLVVITKGLSNEQVAAVNQALPNGVALKARADGSFSAPKKFEGVVRSVLERPAAIDAQPNPLPETLATQDVTSVPAAATAPAPREAAAGSFSSPDVEPGKSRGYEAPTEPIARAPQQTQTADMAVTTTGREVPVDYAVVDLSSLTTSHNEDGATNPAFPAALQPRDRARGTSQAQIAEIAARLDPRLLGKSVKASDGAPIISPSGVVESGNGRTLALARAYRMGGEKIAAYQQFIRDQGFNTNGVEQPVLVRIRKGDMTPADIEAFTREANQRDTAGFSATEQAASDARALPGSLLDLYRGGDVDTAGNREFVRKFMGAVVPTTEQVGMIAADGSMSQEAVRRITSALVQRAYGNSNLVTKLAESTDSNIKAIGGAMADVSGAWAKMTEAAKSGVIDPSMDITPAVNEAVAIVERARREGKGIADLVGQSDIFSGEAVGPVTEGVLRLMFRGKNFTSPVGRDKLAQRLNWYVDQAMLSSADAGLFGPAEKTTPGEVLGRAQEKFGEQQAGQGALFGQAERPDAGDGGGVRQGVGAGNRDGEAVSGEGGQGSGAEGERGLATTYDQKPEPQKAAVSDGEQTAPSNVDQEAKAPARVEDFGEKIGGARKDQWAERGLRLSDLEGMAEGEAFKYVTKDQVWPKPDYAKRVQDGMLPEVAAAIKIIRDSLAAKPRVDSAQGRRDYVTMLNHVRNVLGAARSLDDIKAANKELIYNRAGIAQDYKDRKSEGQAEARALLFSVFKGRTADFSIDYERARKIRKMVDEGFPTAEVAPWKRRFEVRPWRVSAAEGTQYAVRSKGAGNYLPGRYATVEEAEAAAAAQYESDKAPNADGTKKTPDRPHLDDITRTGEDYRAGRDITPEDFAKDFGFRGVEFGNWVASDERQRSVNLAYEALHDLARVIGVEPQAMSLNGQLGMAFGARGSGKALAHYEPGKLVINLTKLSGAGSLAHEWGHAVDHYFGTLDTDMGSRGAPKGASGWYDRPRSYTGTMQNLRPEMREKFSALMEAIFQRDQTKAEQVRGMELSIESLKGRIDQQQARIEQAKAKPNRDTEKFVKQSEEWIAQQNEMLLSLGKRLAEATDSPKPLVARKVDTSFYANAKSLSGKAADKGYWARPTEMFARAFESYVFDRVRETGNVSDYLVHAVEGERYDSDLYKGNPYPKGNEREAINFAFDDLFTEMQQEQTDKGIRLYSKPERLFRDTTDGETDRDTLATIASLTDRLAKLNLSGKVNLAVKDVINGDPRIAGSYHLKLITVAMNSAQLPEMTVDHEVVHAVRELGLFRPAEWNALSRDAAKDATLMASIERRYPMLDRAGQMEEAVADRFMQWANGVQEQGFIGRAFARVREFFDALGGLLRGEGFASADAVMRALDRGDVGRRAGKVASNATPKLSTNIDDVFASTDAPFERTAADGPGGYSGGPVRDLLGSPNAGSIQVVFDKMDAVRENLQDKMISVLRTQEAVTNGVKRGLDENQNAYLAEELYSGRSGRQLEQLYEERVEPLMQAMHEQGVDLDELETYLYARHATERNAQIAKINPEFGPGEGSGMTDTQARAILNRAKNAGKEPVLQALAGYVDKINAEALQARVDSGLLSEEEAMQWRQTYKHYVPLRGKAEVEGDVSNAKHLTDRARSQSGMSVKGKEGKRAFGRRSQADNILSYVILQAEEAIVRSEKNLAAKAFLRLAEAHPDPDFWQVDKVERRPVMDSATGLVRYENQSRLSAEDAPYTVSAKVDGVEHRVTMNRDNPIAEKVAAAMRNLDGPKFGTMMAFAAKFGMAFSAINTRFNPAFVGRNALRDAQTMAFISQAYEGEMPGFTGRVARDYGKAMFVKRDGDGEWSKWRREWEFAGGKIYFNDMRDLGQIKKQLAKRAKHMASPRSAAAVWEKTFDWLEAVNEGVERAIRLSVYKNAREMGKSKAEAASMSRNVTVNFSRKGKWSPYINALFPFFNASVQGSTNLIRVMKNKRVRTAAAGFIIAGILADLFNSMVSGDDDDGQSFWDKVPDYEKSKNLILMVPGGTDGEAIKIPLAWGLNALFGMGRNASAVARGAMKPGAAAIGSALEFYDAFNPIAGSGSWINSIAPTFLDPFIEASVNKDFTGKPIQPEQSPFETPKPGSENYSGQPGWSKGVAKAINAATGGDAVVPGKLSFSPNVIEHFTDFATGGAGRFVGDLVDLVAHPFDPEAEPLSIRDFPIAKDFATNKSPWVDRTLYWERVKQVREVEDRAKRYSERGDGEGLQAYAEENRVPGSLIGLTKAADKIMSAERKTRNQASFAHEMGNMDDAAYAELIRTVREREDQVVQAYNARWNETVKAAE